MADGSALQDFLRRENAGSPVERRRAQPGNMGDATADFLAREALGSPIEAAELGRPVNGMDADPSAYSGDLNQLHAKLVDWFEQAERATTEEREEAERDRDYVNNIQWTEEEVRALRKRNQPVITINKIADKVALLCGLERKARSDPKAYPRTPTEEERADAATQALRYIADENNLPVVTSDVYENMLVEGFGGAELGLEDDGQGGASITVTHVPWDRIWRDPHSRAKDFSDARYLGTVIWMDRDQLEEMYPGADEVVADSFAPSPGTFDDKPGSVAWRDTKRQRCRTVQVYWFEAGTWWIATISHAGFLAEPQQSPFLDRKGNSACPLILMSAYIDRENRRYGMVRGLIGLQDEINKRRSKALHLLSVNRTIAEQGAVDNVQKARQEVAKPDGFIEVNPGLRFEILPGGDLAMGQMQMLEHATAEMQAKGPNAAMSGTDPRDQSGRAIIAQQAGGAAANEPLADSLRQWKRRVCEMAWMAFRQYCPEEKFLRITDDEGTTKWLPLNRPITLVEDLMSKPEPERAAMMQQMQLVPGDPRLDQVVRVENEIHNLDVDIVIEEGQDVPALQAEQFQVLANMTPNLPPPMQVPAYKMLIKSSNLKDKADLLKMLDEAEKAAAQAQQQQQPIIQADAAAEIRGKNAKASADEALAAERLHGAVALIAGVHKAAAESPVLPVDGPGIQPKTPGEGGA